MWRTSNPKKVEFSYLRMFRALGRPSLRAITAVGLTPFAFSNPRSFCAAASGSSAGTKPLLDVTVYQYKICPFCNKVKTFLEYVGVPYETVEVNPLSKKEIRGMMAQDGATFSKVPVVTIDGASANESNDVIFWLRELLVAKTDADPALSKKLEGLMTEDTEKWAEWTDKTLAVMLYPNITRNFSESWDAFNYCGDVQSWSVVDRVSNRYLGPVAMLLANGKIKKKYGIVNERDELKEVCKEWTSAVAKSQSKGPFLHGARVTMPDLMVFGVLKAIAGLSTFQEIMQEDPELMQWYVKVSDEVSGV